MKQFRKSLGKWRNRFATSFGFAAAAALIPDAAKAELVEVDTQSYTRLSDGSLQVTFTNGRSVIVPDGDWTLVNGRVFIENTAISLSGSGTSGVATNASAGSSLFGAGVSPVTLAAGGLGLGLLAGSSGGGSSSDSGSGSSSSENIRSTGVELSGRISNDSSTFLGDEAGTVVISDLSSLFTGASGAINYSTEVRNSSGLRINGLLEVKNGQLLILQDPEGKVDDTYTVTVTGTDSSNGRTATAQVTIIMDVHAEVAEFKATGTILTNTLSNKTTGTGDEANTNALGTNSSGAEVDLSGLFQNASGTVSYSVSVQGPSGSVSNLFYVNGAKLLLLRDPEADESGIYTITVTGTDSDGSETAQGTAIVTLDLQSESTTNGTISNLTKSGNLSANADIIADLNQYFTTAEGAYTFAVSVTKSTDGSDASLDTGAQTGTYDNLLSISGSRLVLARALTDELIEEYTNNANSTDNTGEDIILSVTITATDTADNRQLTPQTFKLTLDAKTNDAPELVNPSQTFTINQESGGAVNSLNAGETIQPLDLSSFVSDDENTIVWDRVLATSGNYSISSAGVLTGTAGSQDETITVRVLDNGTDPTPLLISVFVDIA